eukprot:TRINITY_DN96623_c0_g1_i1.p1 TRINITY_DN96623_c0_g1~~TRINITY_DN96623_c0_g1_i1.p1  ORF type:complete len:210 (+),score=45.10 TRINITY_DN96623_c0_g1_i1:145-774(+)
MSYSKGVLIHNYNEDRYGAQLGNSGPLPHVGRLDGGRDVSVSHMVHNWKTPAPSGPIEVPAIALDKHVLFGHTGDMRDPHTNLQKVEFATASQYFMQDPANIKEIGTLTADKFAISADPEAMVGGKANHHVTKMRMGWGDMRQTHALTPDDRFTTTAKLHYTQPKVQPGQQVDFRMPRPVGEFSKQVDAVQLTRSSGVLQRTGSGVCKA